MATSSAASSRRSRPSVGGSLPNFIEQRGRFFIMEESSVPWNVWEEAPRPAPNMLIPARARVGSSGGAGGGPRGGGARRARTHSLAAADAAAAGLSAGGAGDFSGARSATTVLERTRIALAALSRSLAAVTADADAFFLADAAASQSAVSAASGAAAAGVLDASFPRVEAGAGGALGSGAPTSATAAASGGTTRLPSAAAAAAAATGVGVSGGAGAPAVTCAVVPGTTDDAVRGLDTEKTRLVGGITSSVVVSSAASEMERLRLAVEELTTAKRKLTIELQTTKKEAEEKVKAHKVLEQKYSRLVQEIGVGGTSTPGPVPTIVDVEAEK